MMFPFPGISVSKGDGYNVFVKTRQYYRGKPRGVEKFRKLTNKSLGYDDAMSLMGSALDNSIAQQGYIKPSGRPATKPSKFIPDSWNNISFKFDNKNGKFLEQRNYAIDSWGESHDLDVYRWYQQLPQVKKPRRGEMVYSNPVTSIDMYSFDKINNMFDKTSRRMRIWGR